MHRLCDWQPITYNYFLGVLSLTGTRLAGNQHGLVLTVWVESAEKSAEKSAVSVSRIFDSLDESKEYIRNRSTGFMVTIANCFGLEERTNSRRRI